MGSLAHQGAAVICAHGGQAMPTTPNPRVTVGGQATVRSPRRGRSPAAAAAAAGRTVRHRASGSPGTARVTSMGQPLVIQGGSAICAPTGVPLTVTAVQPRVVAT